MVPDATMIRSKQIPLPLKDALARAFMRLQKRGVLFGAYRGQRQSADIVQHARGVGNVLVHEPRGGHLLGDQGTSQVMAPDNLHGR